MLVVIKVFHFCWCFILAYGFSVSQYPQFYNQYLDKYQVCPNLHMGYFEGYSGEKAYKELGVIYIDTK